MSHERAFGSICLGVDSVQHAGSSKLESVEPGSVEAYYMLAAFCFDAARKMEYIYKATREFRYEADSALAREIKADNEAVRKAGGENGDWQRTAEQLELIIRRLYKEIGAEHEEALERVAKGGSKS